MHNLSLDVNSWNLGLPCFSLLQDYKILLLFHIFAPKNAFHCLICLSHDPLASKSPVPERLNASARMRAWQGEAFREALHARIGEIILPTPYLASRNIGSKLYQSGGKNVKLIKWAGRIAR